MGGSEKASERGTDDRDIDDCTTFGCVESAKVFVQPRILKSETA